MVGAGGKTTLVYRLAAEARAAGLTVLVTTTTHMGTLAESTTGPVLVEAESTPDIEADLGRALATDGRATILGRRVRPDKLEGLAPERVDALASRADVLLVEADGARGRSLKVPALHEPVIPSSTTLVIVVAGLDALGRPLDAATVHRLDLVCAATGAAEGAPITPALLAAALAHAPGYPSRVGAGMRAGVFLNKADDEAGIGRARAVAVGLRPPYSFVAAGSARTGQAMMLS